MRICLYTCTAHPKLGGQEAVVDALARQFLAMGHEPTVLAPRPRLPLRPLDSQLPYPVLRHPRFYSTRHLVGWYQTFLMRAARQMRFDLVHCHDVYPTGYVASLCRQKLRIPLVITSHGGDVRAGNVRLAKTGMRPRFVRAIRMADALISIGQFTRDGFLQLGADASKIVTIPNGVDLTPFRDPVDAPANPDPLIENGKYLLFMGRLSHRKGVDTLLRAVANTRAVGGIELVIAGTGDEEGNIRQLIAQLDLQSRVRLVGRADGSLKVHLLRNAMCVVMPSRGWEAFPLVVLEAFAAGKAVMASRIAGLEDVIEDGVTGKLVTAESIEDWTRTLDQVRGQPQLQQWGEAARSKAADFAWDKIASAHLQLYQSLMK